LERRLVVPDDAARLPGGSIPPFILGMLEVLGLLEDFGAFTFMLFLGDPRIEPAPGRLL